MALCSSPAPLRFPPRFSDVGLRRVFYFVAAISCKKFSLISWLKLTETITREVSGAAV
jgi:hypothetical protein